MAAESGSANIDVGLSEVEQRLRDDPCPFDFFQAVRLLGRLGRGRRPVGRFAHPRQEAVRFRVHNALPFPASQIQGIVWPDGEAPTLKLNFMGLTGPSGVLPLSYTELVIERAQAKDRSLEAFFDLFNHRLLSLFYQAWEKYRFFVGYERDRQDQLSHHLRALIGIGTPGLENRQSVPDESLLFYTGLLSPQPRSATALRDMLADYFQVPVEIDQFVGGWYPLERRDQLCFEAGHLLSEQLGLGAVAGDEVWNQQARVRIRLGPLSREQYDQFLPTGSAYPALCAFTKFFAGDQQEFEAQLILRRDDVPPCELAGDDDLAPQLGWVTWMKSKPSFNRDPADTIIPLQEGGGT